MRMESSTAFRSCTGPRAGAVTVKFRSMWADRDGTRMTPMDKGAIDTVCIYCPETDECYYVRPDAHGASVTLRIAPSRNGQQAGVLDAAAFRSCRAQFAADLSESALLNDALSRAASGVDQPRRARRTSA
jgi:PD-(D/E)XK endonuclease